MKYHRNTFLVNWRLMLKLQWAALLNFTATWQWSLTFSSSSSISFLQIQQMLLDWNCSSSSFMIKFLLKCFFITFLQCWYSLRIALIKIIGSIFTSKNNYWLGKFIINTNKLVSKTTRNVILILFWVRTFITFNSL